MKTLLTSVIVVFALLSTLAAQENQSEPELTKFESSILGRWYFGGDKSKICYIVNAGKVFFAINETQDTLQIEVKRDSILRGFRPNYVAIGKVNEDILIWSNGYWWSRHPIEWESAN